MANSGGAGTQLPDSEGDGTHVGRWPLDRTSPSSLVSQLRDHIKLEISMGTLSPGQRLPAVRSLAQSLSVSPKTVKAAYRLLQLDALIEGVAGKGTIVKEPIGPGRSGIVTGVMAGTTAGSSHDPEMQLRQAATAAAHCGLSLDDCRDIVTQAYTAATIKGPNVVFIECSLSLAKKLSRDIESLGLAVRQLLVSDLPRFAEEMANGSTPRPDAAITTFFHYGQVMQAVAGSGLPVLAVLLRTPPETLDSMRRLAEDAPVGVVCRDDETIPAVISIVRQHMPRARISGFNVRQAAEIRARSREIELFISTSPCLDRVTSCAHGKPVACICDEVDASSLEIIRQYFAYSRPAVQ